MSYKDPEDASRGLYRTEIMTLEVFNQLNLFLRRFLVESVDVKQLKSRFFEILPQVSFNWTSKTH